MNTVWEPGRCRKLPVIVLISIFLLASYSQGTARASDPGISNRPQPLPALDEEATLSDYLAYAALNNPGLEAAFNRWKAALERIPQVRALPEPRFTYSYYIQEVETRVGPQRQKFGLSQMFPWFGKLRLRGDVASQVAEVERQRYEAAKLKLFHQVKVAYYEYSYLARAIAITEENVHLITYFEEVARTKYMTGASPYGAVIKAQVELGKLEDRLRSLNDLREPAAAELNASLNRPMDTFLPWPSTVEEDEVLFSSDQLFPLLAENNPELKAIDSVAAKEKLSVDLAGKNFYPDINVGVMVIDTDDALMPGTPESGKDPVISTISINLPLWYGKLRASKREAEARHTAALQERKDKENRLSVRLKMAQYKFQDAERKIDLYRDTLVPRAEQALSVTQQDFAAGKVDFLDLIDAQRVLLEFELSHERALANRAQSLAKIEMLIGTEVSQNEDEGVVLEKAP